MGGEGEHVVTLPVALDQIERRAADRAGGAEDGDASRLTRSRQARDQDEQGGEDHGQQAVEPVEHSAMAGKNRAAVLDPGRRLTPLS